MNLLHRIIDALRLGPLIRFSEPRYDLRDACIEERCYGRFVDSIALADIVAWEIFLEMGFDKVTIHLRDESGRVWLDFRGDLIALLSQHIGAARSDNVGVLDRKQGQ